MDGLLAELAALQHGVVARGQLLAAGLSERMVDHRLGVGHLQRVHRGVYSVGHPNLTRPGRWMAATLAGGPRALLSHDSATMLWGAREARVELIHVTAPRKLQSTATIRFHRADVPADERAVRDGIPTVSPFRAILDFAGSASTFETERALHRAEIERLTDSLTLRELIARYPGRRGVARLRLAAESLEAGALLTRSQLEDRFLRFLDSYGLPRPETNVWLELAGQGFEVDCLWRRPRVIVELDGWAFHNDRRSFDRDRTRMRTLTAAGWQALPLTAIDIERDAARLAADLRRLVS